jgi:hypothetical protein
MFAYIRSILSYLLSNLKTQSQTVNMSSLNTIKLLLQEVKNSNNILLPFLKEQVANIETQLSMPYNPLNDSQFIQTSAFLGLGRGICTPSRVTHRNGNINDITEQMNNANICTPFSNRVQREITNTLNLTLSQDPTN